MFYMSRRCWLLNSSNCFWRCSSLSFNLASERWSDIGGKWTSYICWEPWQQDTSSAPQVMALGYRHGSLWKHQHCLGQKRLWYSSELLQVQDEKFAFVLHLCVIWTRWSLWPKEIAPTSENRSKYSVLFYSHKQPAVAFLVHMCDIFVYAAVQKCR